MNPIAHSRIIRSSNKVWLQLLSIAAVFIITENVSIAQNGFGGNSNNGFSNSFQTSSTGLQASGQWQSPWQAAVSGTGNANENRWAGWHLDAEINNTNTGVEIVRMVRGGSAEQAGFHVGDRIIAVDDFRVGNVGNRRFDVLDEIQNRANRSNGRVRILYQDAATRVLNEMALDLNRTATSLAGRVSLSSGRALPAFSVLHVQLVNRTMPQQQINGGQQVSQVSGSGPFSYELHYDPAYINPQHQYEIVAYTDVSNQRLLARQPIQIDPRRKIDNLNLVLQAPHVQTASSTVQLGFGQSQSSLLTDLDRVFQVTLGRSANTDERNAWLPELENGLTTVKDVLIRVLASPQFFESVRENPQQFIDRSFSILTDRRPNNQELNRWLQFYQQARGARLPVVRAMAQSL